MLFNRYLEYQQQNIKRIIIKVLYLIILTVFSFQSYTSKAQVSIKPEKSLTDTVDLGITYRKDNAFIPLRASFIVNNDTQQNLRIEDGNQTSAIFSVDAGADQTFRQFTDGINTFPVSVNPTNKLDTVIVQYLYPQVPTEFDNKNRCKYIVGLLDEGNNLVYQDTFSIIARKTSKYVGAYEESIDFDSVYIGNQFQVSKNWFVRNVWTTPQRIFKDEYKLISSQLTDSEFSLDRLDKEIVLAPDRDAIDWQINYSPIDTKLDEAIYKLYFYPFGAEGNTDIIDSVQTRISGVGVNQKLIVSKVLTGEDLTLSDGNYTIDLGTMRPGDNPTVTFSVQNVGNFPLGFKSETILNDRGDAVAINDGIRKSKHLVPTLSDTITLEIVAGEGGNIDFKYQFESDLLSRNITGAQKTNSIFNVQFIGTVKQPILTSNRDSVDFGAVTITNSGTCQTFSTKDITFRNIGNDILEFYDILVEDTDNYMINYNKNMLSPQEALIVSINYEPQLAGGHTTRLLIISNIESPRDTTYIYLKGVGVPQTEMSIDIDSVKSFPGTQVIIPLIVEKEKIVNANIYTDILKYNRTLLQFVEPIFIGTATSERSLDTKFDLNKDGNLEIKIKRQSEDNFLESDTLVLLKFDSFLGNQSYSYLEFTNSKIGNENCDQLFDLKTKRGIYMTDSVCGLEFKTYDSQQGVAISQISPNPISDESSIEIYSPIDMEIDILVIDMLGEVKTSINNMKLKEGTNSLHYNGSNLSNGVYNLILRKERIITMKTIIINR